MELPGIFNWSMEGLQRLRANQYAFSDSKKISWLKKEMMVYCKPIYVFISERIMQGSENDRIKSSDVFACFRTWAENKCIDIRDYDNPRRFRKAFLEALRQHNIQAEVKKRSVDYYVGIVLGKSTL
jgi:putative DNA primase/helicase